MIPAAHPLASVRDAFNAVFIEGPKVGPADVLRARRGRRPDGHRGGGRPRRGGAAPASRRAAAIGCTCALDRRIRPMDDTRGQYYLNLHVEDRPGVLAEIADHFGRNGVSIERVWQEGAGDEATLVFITHRAQEGAFQKTAAGAPRAHRGAGGRERPARRGRGVTRRPDARRSRGPARTSGAG